MSLLIKALQKAEQSKAGTRAEKPATAENLALEPTPHHDRDSAEAALAHEGGFSEPAAPLTPSTKPASTVEPERPTDREAAANLLRARTAATGVPGGRRAFWLGVGGLVILLLLGAGFYFYLNSLQQAEVIAIRPAPAQPASAIAKPAAPVVADTAPVAELPSSAAAIHADKKPAEPVAQAKPASAEKPLATATVDKKPDTEDKAVKVSRNRKSEPAVNATAMAAYQAFMAGDDATAARLYHQLLQADPRNVDALLGLAATAARQDNADEAARNYMRALELEPKNSIAQAGMITLLGQADPVAAESRLKSLLAQQPDAAYLHATLGGIYAEQSRWPDAQQSYFQAVRLDPTSGEYAFNLAASLDQMGKPDLALDYYQRARDLLPKQGGTVDRTGLDVRINQLRSSLGK